MFEYWRLNQINLCDVPPPPRTKTKASVNTRHRYSELQPKTMNKGKNQTNDEKSYDWDLYESKPIRQYRGIDFHYNSCI